MKRYFSIEWPCECGRDFVNVDSFKRYLTSMEHISPNVKISVADITAIEPPDGKERVPLRGGYDV
jgi:hypothetical protein